MTCREYLGWTAGICPDRPAVADRMGREFCTAHARERGIA